MLQAFIVGSSIVSTFVSLAYIGHAFSVKGRPSFMPYEWIAVTIPVIYGAANVVNVYFGDTMTSSLTVGALVGLALSIVGRFALRLPTRIFSFSVDNEWAVHPIAMVLYALIFGFVVHSWNKQNNF